MKKRLKETELKSEADTSQRQTSKVKEEGKNRTRKKACLKSSV